MQHTVTLEPGWGLSLRVHRYVDPAATPTGVRIDLSPTDTNWGW